MSILPQSASVVSRPVWRCAGGAQLAFAAASAVFVGGVVGGSVWAGVAWHGDSAKYFNENTPATWATVALLLWCGGLCWAVSRRLEVAGDGFAGFWWAGAVAFTLAGLDDGLRLHELVDHTFHDALGLDRKHPVTDHIDDVLVLGYAIILSLATWHHRRRLLALPRVVVPFALGGVAFAGMVALDMTAGAAWLEEGLKLAAAAAFLTGAAGAWWPPPHAVPPPMVARRDSDERREPEPHSPPARG